MKRFLCGARVFLASLVSFTLGIFVTAIITLIVAVFSIFGMGRISRVVIPFWSRFAFWIVLRRLHISGRENMVKGKPYLVVSNHGSYYDIPAVMAVLPGIAWVARESLFRIPVFGFALRQIGMISIDAKNFKKSGKSIELATQKAKGRRSVGIFPEGTRSPDGAIHDFKRGFIRILRAGDLDILPVTLNGFYTLWKRGRFAIDPAKKLEIIVHPPLSGAKLLHMKDQDIMREVKAVIEKDYRI